MLLEAIFGDLKIDELIEIRLIDKHNSPPPVEQHFFGAVKEAVDFATSDGVRDGPFEAYFGVTPRKFRGGTKDDVSRVKLLWVDVDSKDGVSREDAWKKAADGMILPPSAIVDSGHGFHAYWFLTEEIPKDRAENLMKQIETRLGTDSVHDVSRVMRVPNTLNKKGEPAVKVALLHLRTDLKYALSDVSASLVLPRSTCELITSGSHKGFRSRSERDFAVARDMLHASLSREAIRCVFRERPVGEKFLEAGEGYLDRTLSNADKPQSDIKNDIPDTVVPPPFTLKNNCLYYPGQGGRQLQVSTFAPVCNRIIEAVDGTGDVLICNMSTGGGQWKNIPIPKSAFSGIRELIRQLPVASWQWLGSERQVRLLLPWLIAKWKEAGGSVAKSTSVVGRYQSCWVGPDQLVTTEGITGFDESKIVFLSTGREPPGVHYDIPNEDDYRSLLSKIAALLPRINDPSVVLPVLWWYMAAPLKTQLELIGIRFPILDVFGTRGSGKTSLLLRVMQPLAGITKPRSYDCSTTPFVLLSLLASTNGVPIPFSDFRRQNLTGDRYNTLLRLILLSYDVGHDARGRPNQTLQMYPLSAPFHLDGEDPVYDPAVKERCIIVNMRPEAIRYGTDAFSAFQDIVTLPLQSFAGRYIQYTLSYSVGESYSQAMEMTHSFVPEVIPDRNRRNLAVLLTGYIVLSKFYKHYGVEYSVSDEVIKQALVPSLQESVDLQTGRTHLYVDEFVEEVINAIAMAPTQVTPVGFIYKLEPSTKELLLHLSTAYNWWVLQRRRTGKPVLEQAAIKHQLQERDSSVSSGVGQYVRGRKAVTFGGSTKWVYVISIDEATRAGMDIPSSLVQSSVRIVE